MPAHSSVDTKRTPFGTALHRCITPARLKEGDLPRRGWQLEKIVDKNRVEGAKRQAKGSMKEAAGKLTGDRSQEAKGKMEKNVGKGQREVGKAADRSRDQH